MIRKNKKIIIVAGDPNSINSEIIYKSWKKLNKNVRQNLFIIGNYELLKRQLKILNYHVKIKVIKNFNDFFSSDVLNVIDVDLKFSNPFKVTKKEASKYILDSLDLAHNLSLKGNILGMINCPISKNLLNKEKTGVTELLSEKCKIKKDTEVMMIKSDNFSVCPITTHIDLKDVSKNIKTKKIILKVKTINIYFNKILKKKPRIGVLGLNPHNAELRNKSEEVLEIIPAIKTLKKLGLNINGPLITDTIFVKDYRNFDVIVGMYHDQVLTTFKSIFKFNAINLTLGLKYLRVSPDHGVALDIIKKNKASCKSLLECVKFINKFGK
tara:strand:+ start:7412 stop:8386 length:975 start_codon:yes stop_codon:yes gene_type:complete